RQQQDDTCPRFLTRSYTFGGYRQRGLLPKSTKKVPAHPHRCSSRDRASIFSFPPGRMGRECSHAGCTKQPSYGVAGTETAEFCSGHANDGMVDVVTKKCTRLGCTKQPRYGMAGTKMAEFCSGQSKGGMVDVVTKKCTH
ncbi:unnamed protein product, partial [Pylaiella littoralis]